MQQVKFKPRSMEAARHGNEQDYYLFAINGDYAVVKYIDVNVWRSKTVNLVALEVVTPCVVLPAVPVAYDDEAMCDRLAALIQTVFTNEAEFMQHFAINGTLIDGGVACFYMASERCFVRYQYGAAVPRDTTIRTDRFLEWVEGLRS